MVIKEAGIHIFQVAHYKAAINTSSSFCHRNIRQHYPLSGFGHGPLRIKYIPSPYYWNSRQAFLPPWSSLGNTKFSIQGALLKVGCLLMKVRVHICADDSNDVSTMLPVFNIYKKPHIAKQKYHQNNLSKKTPPWQKKTKQQTHHDQNSTNQNPTRTKPHHKCKTPKPLHPH